MFNVKNIVKAGIAAGAVALFAGTASAAEAAEAATAATSGFGDLGKGLSIGLAAGLAVLGGATGISKIGSSAVESIARQPEAAGPIGSNALILSALIEGATLFAVVVGLLAIVL